MLVVVVVVEVVVVVAVVVVVVVVLVETEIIVTNIYNFFFTHYGSRSRTSIRSVKACWNSMRRKETPIRND